MAVLGEALVDLFATGVERAAGERSFAFSGHPGGAPCNLAAHLAAQGIETSLISAFADDLIGRELRAQLGERGIDLSAAVVSPAGRSPLVVVQTDQAGERTFTLYIKGSVLEEFGKERVDTSKLAGASWFHFGSVLLAYALPAGATKAYLETAARRDVPVSYDVNVREPVWNEAQTDPAVVAEVLRFVDVVKVSDEDWAWMRRLDGLAGSDSGPRVLLSKGPALVVWTHGKDGATLMTERCTVKIEAPNCEVVDTTGAGDAFMSGVIASFVGRGFASKEELCAALDEPALRAAGELGRARAALVLSQRGAIPRLG